MTLNKLAKEITLREGKKKQINIAQVKEIIGIISDLVYEMKTESLVKKLWDNGEKRAKKKSKLKKEKK